MDSPALPTTKRPGLGTAVLLLLAGGLLGAVLGCLVLYFWPHTLFNPFRALPALPEPAAHLAGATIDSVTVETGAGRLFWWPLTAEAAAWQPVETAENESDEPCEQYATGAPAIDQVVERRIACQNLAEAGTTTVFVLREDGRVWYWTSYGSSYLALTLIVFAPLCGGSLGLVVGLVVFSILRRRSRP